MLEDASGLGRSNVGNGVEVSQEAYHEEPRIRALTKEITAILNGPLAEKLKELEDIYGEKCRAHFTEIYSKLVLIEQQDLPVAEMIFKGIGEQEDDQD